MLAGLFGSQSLAAIKLMAGPALRSAQKLGQLGSVCGNAARLVLSEQLGGRPENCCIAATDVKDVAKEMESWRSYALLGRNRRSKLLASAIHCLSSDEFIVSISLLLSLFGKQFEDPQSI